VDVLFEVSSNRATKPLSTWSVLFSNRATTVHVVAVLRGLQYSGHNNPIHVAMLFEVQYRYPAGAALLHIGPTRCSCSPITRRNVRRTKVKHKTSGGGRCTVWSPSRGPRLLHSCFCWFPSSTCYSVIKKNAVRCFVWQHPVPFEIGNHSRVRGAEQLSD